MSRSLVCILIALLIAGCHKQAAAPAQSPKECIDEIVARIQELPEKPHLTTLNSQTVNL